MGRVIAELLVEDPQVQIVGASVKSDDPVKAKPLTVLLEKAPKDIFISNDTDVLLSACDVLIDFTSPKATMQHLSACEKKSVAMVIGTTGFNAMEEEKIAQTAATLPLVKAGNMSLGVNLLISLVEQAARSLGDEYDIEIFEAHHRHKKDAPSGTALMLGRAAANGRGVALSDVALDPRDGIIDERPAGGIGFSVLRGGGIIGEHEVNFASNEEVITLSHRAIDRTLFAKGAITAAKWLHGQPAGQYSMQDVLGL